VATGFHRWVKKTEQKEPSGTYIWICKECNSIIWHASRPAPNRRVGVKHPADPRTATCGELIVLRIMES
jgi:predicted RNA-binding protein with PUA domain